MNGGTVFRINNRKTNFIKSYNGREVGKNHYRLRPNGQPRKEEVGFGVRNFEYLREYI